MELRTDPATLREKYQKVMDKFVYEGGEPEEKARLRHLLRNQWTFVTSMAPEPEDWNAWTEERVREKDWPGLCRVMNQRGKIDMMPSIYGSYCYERNFHCMLECFACGNTQVMDRLLPWELTKVQNSNEPFFPAAAHVMIGLWYRDPAVLEWAVPAAEKFMRRKSSTLLEKAMLSFLLDLAGGDMDKAGEDLLGVCRGYPRDQKYMIGRRPFCTLAHGLYCLAQVLLPEEAFQALEMPSYHNFLPDFALWRREHPDPDRSLWFRYPEDLALLNGIYEAPPARLVLSQPFLDSPRARPRERQYWMADGVRWVNEYVDELWELGAGRN